jgi:hypothetical protein
VNISYSKGELPLNATVTTTVTLVIQQSPYEIWTVIAALAAFGVSAFTLYFTSLKGPNIVLPETPQFIQKAIQRESFDRFIPHTIVFETNLIFLNNGTASGVLRMDAHFEPVKELIPFFNRDKFMFGTEYHRYTSSNSMPAISIHEKGSTVVYIELTVEFHDWRRYFVREPVPKDQIRQVLCQADSENKKRFHDFCAILKNDMHIGTVSIKSYQTTRKKTEESQHIGVLDEELIGNFRSWEERWDTIDPDAILMEVRQVRERFGKELHDRVNKNLKTLMGITELEPLETDLLDTVRRRFNGFESRAAIAEFVLHSANLDSLLKKYDLQTRDWNRILNLWREDTSRKTLEQTLIAERPSLETESAHLVIEIADLLNTLQECYMSRP